MNSMLLSLTKFQVRPLTSADIDEYSSGLLMIPKVGKVGKVPCSLNTVVDHLY